MKPKLNVKFMPVLVGGGTVDVGEERESEGASRELTEDMVRVKLDIVRMPDVSNGAREGTSSESLIAEPREWIGIIEAKQPNNPQNRNPKVLKR